MLEFFCFFLCVKKLYYSLQVYLNFFRINIWYLFVCKFKNKATVPYIIYDPDTSYSSKILEPNPDLNF